jgi:hypothetical protein
MRVDVSFYIINEKGEDALSSSLSYDPGLMK